MERGFPCPILVALSGRVQDLSATRAGARGQLVLGTVRRGFRMGAADLAANAG